MSWRLPFNPPWHLVLIPLTFILLIPLLWMLITSLETEGEANRFPPVLFPASPQFSNYTEAWDAAPFGHFFHQQCGGDPRRTGQQSRGVQPGGVTRSRGSDSWAAAHFFSSH